MATRLQTLGWTTWIMVLVVVLLVLLAGALYMAE
jgi:Sec-independent protein translocase protein TatA